MYFNKGLNWYALKSVLEAFSEEMVLLLELLIFEEVFFCENSAYEPNKPLLQRSNILVISQSSINSVSNSSLS